MSHFHNRVERVMIDDHNVPSLEMMFELTDSVREWLAGDRQREEGAVCLTDQPMIIIILHCLHSVPKKCPTL